MTKRREAILLLLGSLHDHLPGLGVNFRPTRGLVAAEKQPCPDCGHTSEPGWRRDSFKRVSPCVTCGGKVEPSGRQGGWLKRDGGRGTVDVDPMDSENAPIRTVDQYARPTKPPVMVNCDGCGGSGLGRPYLDDLGRDQRDRDCPHCEGSGKVERKNLRALREPETSEAPDAVCAAIVNRDEAGDYHALDWALATLKPRHRRLVLAVHGPEPTLRESELGESKARHLEASLALLESRMPHRIRVPGYVRAAAKRKREREKYLRGKAGNSQRLARDREIRKLDRQGRPRPWIAREFGLSVSMVARIVSGEREAA